MIRACVLLAALLAPVTHAAPGPRGGLSPSAPSAQLRAWRLLRRHGAPEALYRIAYRESRFQPDATNPRSGCAGLLQFRGETWEVARRRSGLPETASPYNPEHAIIAALWLYSQPNGARHWRPNTRRQPPAAEGRPHGPVRPERRCYSIGAVVPGKQHSRPNRAAASE